jgi:putative ABC transport system permease protein
LIAAAILTLALGAGANTAIFSVIDVTLLRPLPYREPSRLAVLWEANPKMEGFLAQRIPVAGRNFFEWRNRLHAFERIEALRRSSETLTGEGRPENLVVARVTAGFFCLLGRGAWLGRTFRVEEGEPGKCAVAVVSASLFSQKLHSDRHALGRTLILNGAPYKIVGVMPADFHLPALWQGHEEILPDVWLPAAPDVAAPITGESRRNYVFGRLRDGVTIEQARTELSDLARELEKDYPRLDAGFGSSVFPIEVEDVGPAMRRTVLSLQIAVIFVLLIASANVAHLLSARAAGRARETAIRAALGASRVRIARGALAESLSIGASGGALGIALARGGIAAIDWLSPEAAYHLHELTLNWRVLAFSFAVTFCATLVFSLAPALAATSGDLRHALSQDGRAGGGRGVRRAHRVLIAAETAFAAILLVGAGLMIRSMINLLRVDPGFRAAHVLTLRATSTDALSLRRAGA